MAEYRIDLENVTDKNIEIIKTLRCKSKNTAIRMAKKLSSGKEFEKAKSHPNGGFARVWVHGDLEDGSHTMQFEDGKCTYNTIG